MLKHIEGFKGVVRGRRSRQQITVLVVVLLTDIAGLVVEIQRAIRFRLTQEGHIPRPLGAVEVFQVVRFIVEEGVNPQLFKGDRVFGFARAVGQFGSPFLNLLQLFVGVFGIGVDVAHPSLGNVIEVALFYIG